MDFEQRLAVHERRLVEHFGCRLRGRTAVVVDAWAARPFPSLPLPEVMVLPPECWPDGGGGSGRAWPYASGGIDVVLWRHAHECWPLPASLVGETDRILGPDGQLLILGFRPLGHWLCRLLGFDLPPLRVPPRALGAELCRLGFEAQRVPVRQTGVDGWGLPLLSCELRSRTPPGVILRPTGVHWHRLPPNALSWPTRRVA